MSKKPRPINVDLIDLDEMRKKTTDMPGLIEYAFERGGFAITPTKEGEIQKTALESMYGQSKIQLDQIKDQMTLLAKQAMEIQERISFSKKVYQAKINFVPVIGNTYHLYENKKGLHLSMLSPEDWKYEEKEMVFIGSAQLLPDKTWQVIKNPPNP